MIGTVSCSGSLSNLTRFSKHQGSILHPIVSSFLLQSNVGCNFWAEQAQTAVLEGLGASLEQCWERVQICSYTGWWNIIWNIDFCLCVKLTCFVLCITLSRMLLVLLISVFQLMVLGFVPIHWLSIIFRLLQLLLRVGFCCCRK